MSKKQPRLLDFTISSDQVPVDTSQLSVADQLIYEKIIEVRNTATSAEYDAKAQKQFQLDLPRAGSEFAFENSLDVSPFSSDINTKVLRFVEDTFATATKNKISWLRKDKILAMLSYFNQTVPQQALRLLHENITVYRYNKNSNTSDHMPSMYTINEGKKRPYTISFDGMKVTLKFKRSLHYYAEDIDPENTVTTTRDLEVTEQFTLDFSALSPDENQVFLPDGDAITQEIQVRVVNPRDVYIEVSDALATVINDSKPKTARGFAATVFAWLASFVRSMLEYRSKTSAKIIPKTQDHVLPKIDPIVRNEDHTEPGIWKAIRRKLYLPHFLSRPVDTQEPREAHKPLPRIRKE